MSLPTEADIDNAIRRIALSSDGQLLYRRLQMVLMEVSAVTDSGALQRHEGRRTLARDLKLLMDEEMAKVVPTRDRSGTHDPNSPAVAVRAEPVALTSSASRRRVEPYESGTKA